VSSHVAFSYIETLSQLSDGGVHSHQNHLYALLETAKAEGVRNVYVHAITDGRDTDPHGAANGESSYIKKLVEFISDLNKGEPSDFHCQLATVVGRYYAMDRDKRWERVKIAVDALAPKSSEQSDDPKDWSESPKPEITTEDSLISTIESRYAKDETDEFLKPIIVDDGKSSDEWKNLKSRIRGWRTLEYCFDHR
jgi:2,3-bisphosphoglycerate-independent phosphoglycerate mutase